MKTPRRTRTPVESKEIPSLVNRIIDNGRYVLQKRIGSGGYSVVYLAIDLHSVEKHEVAVKCLMHRTLSQQQKLYNEVLLHKSASHLAGVIDIYDTVEEDDFTFIILEYCSGGDLFSMVTEHRLYLGKDEYIRRVFLQLLETISSLHELGIYHRDLKPENVMCSRDGMKVKVADFGLATDSEHSDQFGSGSIYYMTPECIAGCYTDALPAYSTRASDIWALGVILVNLITSRSPWRCAMQSDPAFHRYTRDSNSLHEMLPISKAAFKFVDRIFRNHGNNLSLTDLRKEFLEIDSFYLRGADLAAASKAARIVAREWIPNTPVDDVCDEDLGLPADTSVAALLSDDSNEHYAGIPDDLEDVQTAGSVLSSSSTTRTDFTDVTTGLSTTTSRSIRSESSSSLAQGNCIVPSDSLSTDESSSESAGPTTPETLAVIDTSVVPDLPEKATLGERLKLDGHGVTPTAAAEFRRTDVEAWVLTVIQ